jgi:hypothetical protein
MGRHKIGPADLERMSVDEHGRLFWDGAPLVTDARLALSRTQNIVAVAIAVTTIRGGLGSFVQGLAVLYK